MARNRRLVPMPSKRAASPLPPFEAPAVPVMSTPPPLQVQPPQSLLMQDFPYILLLAGAALAWIFLKPWFVIVGLVLLAAFSVDDDLHQFIHRRLAWRRPAKAMVNARHRDHATKGAHC